jgi:hypothetical protein
MISLGASGFFFFCCLSFQQLSPLDLPESIVANLSDIRLPARM